MYASVLNQLAIQCRRDHTVCLLPVHAAQFMLLRIYHGSATKPPEPRE